MNQIDELKSVERIIHKYNLPMRPIQEYAISEKCEALTGCSEFHDSMTEHDVIGRVREQIQSIMKGYHSSLTLLVDYGQKILKFYSPSHKISQNSQ